MDELDIMLMETGTRDADMQKALSAALRRKGQIGQLAQLTGDEVLKPFGQGLSASVDRKAITEANRMDKKSQRDLTAGYYDFQKGQAGLAQAMANRKQTETERHNQAMEGRVTAGLEKTLTRDVQKLSGALTKAAIPDLQSGISKIDEELAPYVEKGGALPGIGGMSNVGGFAFTSDGRKMQARVAKIRNMILKARSGGAVTPSEADRLMQEFSLGVFNTDEEFLASWADFKDSIAAGERNIYAGFTDDVVDEFHNNLARQSGAGVEVPHGAPGAPETGEQVTLWSDLK